MTNATTMTQLTCNICGSQSFKPGFLGRLSANGRPPACSDCGTVERHRLLRDIYSRLRPISSSWGVLQFAPDKSMDPKWYKSFTSSIYGTSSSLDMLATGLESGSFDVVSSNHVLEHVPDYLGAIRETLRLVGRTGFVQCMVPAQFWDLEDWEFPDPTKNEHYREFGADFGITLTRQLSGLQVMGVIGSDPVTSSADMVYFLSYSVDTLRSLHNLLPRNGVQVVRFN